MFLCGDWRDVRFGEEDGRVHGVGKTVCGCAWLALSCCQVCGTRRSCYAVLWFDIRAEEKAHSMEEWDCCSLVQCSRVWTQRDGRCSLR